MPRSGQHPTPETTHLGPNAELLYLSLLRIGSRDRIHLMSPRSEAWTLAQGLAGRLSAISPTEQDVQHAKRSLRRQRDSRGEPKTRKGYEYVVERLFRPAIEEYAGQHLKVGVPDLHRRCYSSHFHTTDDTEMEWKRKWFLFRRTHASVDTLDTGNQSRRADLFIAAQNNCLISIEFKYVAPRRSPNVVAVLKQVRQHLTGHRATILVVYCAGSMTPRCAEAVQKIRSQLTRERAIVLNVEGPEITFP